MQKALTLHQTTVGKKAIAAVTGLILFLFLIGHLVGNLQVFLGPVEGARAMHDYAVMLRKTGPLLWIARIVLLGSVGLHIWATISLAGRNSDARKTRYQHPRQDQITDYAARTMHWSGPIVGMYILYHLLHLTFGYGAFHDPQNVYDNVVIGFQNWIVSTVYIVANLLLGMHLFHGGWSWLQSIGASHPRYDQYRKLFAIGLAAFITIGNVALPTAVMTGMVTPSEGFDACSELLGPCPDGER
jgi:succinate dehydrogenase / fumarate reductase cytochrome b subunit